MSSASGKITVIGIMTGTSCDGADAAAIEFKLKERTEKLKATYSEAFPDKLRKRLLAAQTGKLKFPELFELERDYSLWLTQFVLNFCRIRKIPQATAVISVHGQTVWHRPELHYSVQIVDPSILVTNTGLTTVAKFRQPDLAALGQGAPLVPYYHWLKMKPLHTAAELPVSVHNIGGIANLTIVTPSVENVVAFDTGPGNAMIDLLVEKMSHGKLRYDEEGGIAARNLDAIDWKIVERLARDPYFKQKPPKSTGRELFNLHFTKKFPGTPEVKIAYATAFTAHTMAQGYTLLPKQISSKLKAVYVAGGGSKNETLLRLFSRELSRLLGHHVDVNVIPQSVAPSDYLEAMAFARLGLEALIGNPVSLPRVTGSIRSRRKPLGVGVYPGQNWPLILKFLNMV